ncbi:MAG TPA: hypothetical protein VFE54_10515 [Mucilaginibacter sp.]|nr:hypothetical protein [Mucilaginibacter sp.]
MKIDQTTRRYFVYSVKVWMSSVLAAPFIFVVVVQFISRDPEDGLGNLISFYLLFAVFECIFSLLTWLMFWMLTMLIVININNWNIQRWLIVLLGIGLTMSTFAMFAPMLDNPFRLNSTMFPLMLINTICIACGTWLFYPDRQQPLLPNNYKSESDE